MTLRPKSCACLWFRYTKVTWFILSENKLTKHTATESWGKMHLGRGCAKKYKETKKPKQSETQIFNFSKTIVKSVFAFVIMALSNIWQMELLTSILQAG